MTDQTNIVIEWVLEYLWVPLVFWVLGSARKQQTDNKEREKSISELKERAAVLEATRMTREDVIEVIETKFEKLEDKIDKLSDNVHDLLRSIPKRTGD